LQPKLGGRFHLKLNILGRPIAKKNCEGKVKRTLKRRLKVLEIVKREANGSSVHMVFNSLVKWGLKSSYSRKAWRRIFNNYLIGHISDI